MINLLKFSTVLVIMTCAAALLATFSHEKTGGDAARMRSAAFERALVRIVPEGSLRAEKKMHVPSSNDSVRFWLTATATDTVYAFVVERHRYLNDFAFLVGVTPDGTIRGMNGLHQNFVQGPDARIDEVVATCYLWERISGKRSSGLPWFTEQFRGLSINRPIMVDAAAGEWHALNGDGRDSLRKRNAVTAPAGSVALTAAIARAIEADIRAYLKQLKG
jgi:Na+-translocating ferredoxin:NAD+ oxidoreductase RnfG subunit